MFVDEAKIFVTGGKGGDGCMSMRREKYRPMGGPAGGKGGRGGSVVLVASRNRKTLLSLRGRAHFRAEPGRAGGKNDRTRYCKARRKSPEESADRDHKAPSEHSLTPARLPRPDTGAPCRPTRNNRRGLWRDTAGGSPRRNRIPARDGSRS